MKLGLVLVVVLGLLAAVSAAVVVQGVMLPARSAGGAPAEADVDVLVATRDLPPMTVVDSSMIEVKRVPRGARPSKALTSPVQAVGKVLMVRALKDGPFGETNFASDGSPAHLAAALPAGKRAVSVALTDHTGMVGLLYPGCVVDVMVSLQFQTNGPGGTGGDTITRTLLQGVQVLAVGSTSVTSEEPEKVTEQGGGLLGSGMGKGDKRQVTLLVEPKEAQALQLGLQTGTISLCMRNPMDRAEVATAPTRVADLAGRMRAGLSDVLASSAFSNLMASWGEGMRARLAAAQAARTPGPAFAAADASKPPAPPAWEALIIRGSASEVRTFAMPAQKGLSAAVAGTRETQTKAAAAADGGR